MRKSNPTLSPSTRVAIYARVSTDEQTRGNYPSCDSQIDELTRYCEKAGFEVVAAIKDEGQSAGSLKRPGLARLRALVAEGKINAVRATWYDRISRARDFYLLDSEFKAHDIDFQTLHDFVDRGTAAGRFMESVVIAAKTYEREQTGEKVSRKARMRAEKGLYSNGPLPFGFLKQPETEVMLPDPEKLPIVQKMFEIYVSTQSDFSVRDFLHSQQIPTRNGKSIWSVGTIRELLTNPRYISRVEINKKRKDVVGLNADDSYRIITAPYEPFVSQEVWDLAQAIRRERSKKFSGQAKGHEKRKAASTTPVGTTRTLSTVQSGHPFILQGLLTCSCCQHPLSPYYVKKIPSEKYKRRTVSFTNYYECAEARKYPSLGRHSNRVLA